MTHTADNTDRQESATVSIYDIDPGLIAAIDQHMTAVGADLDVLLKSYNHHRGNADATVAYAVLTDNMHDCLTFDEAVNTLALAVQRLAEQDSSVGGTTTSSEEQA